ncbi:MAG: serine hydroxymethyltransferase [archaeon GBS-70-058]|nr:serine hydroxymethyltransferase [Candidatus Culexarchaeum nevadense]
MDAFEAYSRLFSLLEDHHKFFSSSIPLIASENITSYAVREALISDFGHRYAEGWPGERVYAGCRYIDQVELLTLELIKDLFGAEFADVRPISGVTANLAVYSAFTEPGDTMICLSIPNGGHISYGKRELGGTAGLVHGLNVEYFPFNYEEMNIDVDKTKKKIEKLINEGVKLKLAMFGASVFLFPHPVKELSDFMKSMGMIVAYDAAHVAGLIAGKCFQDPLREGADVVTISTHKTLPGPQRGAILSWNKYADAIKRAVFPGVTSNHHLHTLAGLCVALCEMKAFGREYATQIIKNAKTLAQALWNEGFKVVAEKKGFTESHTILIDVSGHGGGLHVEKILEDANIIVNRNLLPWDLKMGRHFTNPGGIRIGVSEVTRLGMREDDMIEIASFMKRVVINREDPKVVAKDVAEFRKKFNEIKYCFENAKEAYAYIRIR